MTNFDLEEYATGKIDVELSDGKVVTIKPTITDVAKWLSATKDEGDADSDMVLKILRHMVERANLPHIVVDDENLDYPHYKLKDNATDEMKKEYKKKLNGIKGFFVKNTFSLLTKVPEALNWTSQKELEQQLDKLEKKG